MSKLPGRIFSNRLILCKPDMEYLEIWHKTIIKSLPELKVWMNLARQYCSKQDRAAKLRE